MMRVTVDAGISRLSAALLKLCTSTTRQYTCMA
jgi:hypothetical protein